jgi:hypothetical protein
MTPKAALLWTGAAVAAAGLYVLLSYPERDLTREDATSWPLIEWLASSRDPLHPPPGFSVVRVSAAPENGRPHFLAALKRVEPCSLQGCYTVTYSEPPGTLKCDNSYFERDLMPVVQQNLDYALSQKKKR